MDEEKKPFFTTLAGFLTAVAGLVAAVGTLLGVLYSMNVIGPKPKPTPTTAQACEVPNLVGLDLPAAEANLARVTCSLKVAELQEASKQFDAGMVTRTDPAAGASVVGNTLVRLFVSTGPPPPDTCPVPDILNLDSASAVNLLGASTCMFRATVVEQNSDTVAPGVVIGSEPASGVDASAGSLVTVFISSGIELVTVPDVAGLTGSAATKALHNAGLEVVPSQSRFLAGIAEASDTVQACAVTRTEPAAGAMVPKGVKVQLFVASPGAGGSYCQLLIIATNIFPLISP